MILTLKGQEKNASENVVCCITDDLSIESNSVDPEQTAQIGVV